MQLRLLTPEDALEFWTLRLEALASEPSAFGMSVEEHHAMGVEGTAARLASDPGNRFVVGAFDSRELIGTAGFARETGLKERHKGRVWGVYVAGQMRGQGVGRAVLRSLLDRVRDCPGIEQLVLQVRTQSAARNLYESLGFRSFGTEYRALKIGDCYVDEDYMVLALAASPQLTESR